jgi:aryl-alcohol dehydrogenase-like predicted oxidoreductase
MQFTQLGRTGLKVSKLCLGTMNFGPHTTEADSHALMDKALELGINFFDTADVYGWKRGEGVTEQIIGRWFAKGGGRREKVVLATKVFGDMDPTTSPDVNLARGLSARKIVRCCEASLKRMQTDWIDLFQMHHIDRNCPWEEVWQAMETLVTQGKVVYVGSSNFAGWHIARASETARSRNFLGLVSEQSKYSLDMRTVELEVVPACKHYGLGLIPWSPLAGGVLAGVSSGDGLRRKNEKLIARLGDRLKKWEEFAKAYGKPPADLALGWLLNNPVVTAPIIGPRTIEQLTASLGALDVKFDEAALKAIDEIWPGPGGTAPEAYAW